MPVYDYLCGRCGAFTAMRPMAECERRTRPELRTRSGARISHRAAFCHDVGRASPGAHDQ